MGHSVAFQPAQQTRPNFRPMAARRLRPQPDPVSYGALHAAGSDAALPPFSSVSRPQKLETPTFHMPSWYTAMPDWFVSAGLPDIRIE